MQKNYLIQAHTNPQQLNRLVNTLNDGKSSFYIHIDSKSDINPFVETVTSPKAIFIPNRVNCIWGDYSQVQATLNLLDTALQNEKEGYLILLSGQDYPIKSNTHINTFLKQFSNTNFIDVRPASQIWPQYKDRFEKYRFIFSEKKGDYSVFAPLLKNSPKNIARIAYYLLKGRMKPKQFKRLLKKRIPVISEQYGGSNWWALNYSTAQILYNFVNQNENELFKYYKDTLSADEVFFQSIFKHLSIEYNLEFYSDSLTYANWTRKNCVLPVTFNENDLQELQEQDSHKLYARKFDSNNSSKIFDEIDKLREKVNN